MMTATQDPADKALKTGLVKNELKKQWDLEVAVIKAAQNPKESVETACESPELKESLHQDMIEEWGMTSSESPHPNAAKALNDHLRHIATSPKL